MSTPVPVAAQSGADAAAAALPPRKGGSGDNWGIHSEGGGAQGALASLLGRGGVAKYQMATGAGAVRPLTVDLAGVADTGRRMIVADLREFRAKLPFRLYNAGASS